MLRMERGMEEERQEMEDILYEELWEIEIRRLDLVMNGVEEPEDRVTDIRERTEIDKKSCRSLFRAMKARTTKTGA
jgi:hypothetical protein